MEVRIERFSPSIKLSPHRKLWMAKVTTVKVDQIVESYRNALHCPYVNSTSAERCRPGLTAERHGGCHGSTGLVLAFWYVRSGGMISFYEHWREAARTVAAA